MGSEESTALEIRYIKESITELKVAFSTLSAMITTQTKDIERIKTQHDDRCNAQEENSAAIDKLWEKHDNIKADLDKFRIEAEGKYMPRDAVKKGRAEIKEWLLVASLIISLSLNIWNFSTPKPAPYYRPVNMSISTNGQIR